MTRLPLPLVVDANFFVAGSVDTRAIKVGARGWYSWLANEQHMSFAYRDQRCNFTARRERQRHGWYWYAYRRRNGKTYKMYLGKSEELTLERLRAVGESLLERSAGVGNILADGSFAVRRQDSLQSGQAEAGGTASPVLPEAKFTIPTVPYTAIARPHLLARLEGASRHKLLLLSAPAGWGKTTLLSEWCGEMARQGKQFAWVTVEAQDADPRVFWATLLRAVRAIRSDKMAVARTSDPETAPDEIMKVILQELCSLSTHTFLLLDDYQYLSHAHQQSFTFFVEHLPTHVHLVMAGRTKFPASIAKLRVQGQVLELGTAELALSAGEAFTLLRDRLGLSVSHEMCRSLTEQTEGWAAGVYLAGLGAQAGREERAHVRAHNSYLQEYIIEEILLQLPQELRDFLLYTSVVDYLQAGLCNSLCGCDDSQEKLNALMQRNLCISLAGQRQYRYYRLLRETLYTYLQQGSPTLVGELQGRARLWHEQQRPEVVRYGSAAAGGTVVWCVSPGKGEETITEFEDRYHLVEPVTEREQDVLSLLVKGASNREIAQRLIISEGTVKKHVSNICGKLGVKRRTQAITRALSLALL